LTQASSSIKLRREGAVRTAIAIDPKVREELEVFKIRNGLVSMQAAAHVILCRGLGLEELLPADLAPSAYERS
jgi:hypothetical protein